MCVPFIIWLRSITIQYNTIQWTLATLNPSRQVGPSVDHISITQRPCVGSDYSTVPTFNSCTKCVGSLGIIYDHPRPFATQFPGHGCMSDLTTERSFDSQGRGVIDVLGLYFWHVIDGCLYSRALDDVRSTGAGIKCLYCTSCSMLQPTFEGNNAAS